jgi:hypothetical protein
MKYGLIFLACGIYFAVTAVAVEGLAWLLLWPALSFVIVGLGYVAVGPGIFGKKNQMAVWHGGLCWSCCPTCN